MKTLFTNAAIYENSTFTKADFSFDGVTFSRISSDICPEEFDNIIDGVFIFPGFSDVHVHFREPGFSYKETVKSGSMAAAAGGYTAVCTMPNLKPVPDSPENLKIQTDIIKADSVIATLPYGAITKGELGEELADLSGMAEDVCGFSDDGRGVQSEEMMLRAMKTAKSLGKVIAAHCEDNSLLFGGYIHDGKYARAHGHKGICSKSEWLPIKRDIELIRKSGAAYHVCHVSAKESVELIRAAKREGLDITCETGPHYLIYDESFLCEDERFKMNPPLRSSEDREALISGVLDGTIDMIATDHAPHSDEEKARGLQNAPMGVVGLETAFAAMYTKLVKPGILSLEKLIELMCENPRKRFSISTDRGLTVFDLSEEFTVDPKSFISKGHATPFAGERLFGKCLLTVYQERAVYVNEKIK